MYNFCVVAMSNFYLDVTKDRLYCTNGAARQAAQTAMYKILVALDKIIAPILCFTSQEIWDFLPKAEGMNRYVVFEDMPHAGQYGADDAFKAKWAQLIAVRDEVKKALEIARNDKKIGASLEAAVTLYCDGAVYELLNSVSMDELADLMIVSRVELVKGQGGAASAIEGLGIAAQHAEGAKCERCWKYTADIGTHPAHPPCAPAAPVSSRAEERLCSKTEKRRSPCKGSAVLCKINCQGGALARPSHRSDCMFVFLNLVCIAALVGIDQAIKLWAVQNLQPVGTMPLIPHVVELHFVYNEGMAFSCSAAGRRS